MSEVDRAYCLRWYGKAIEWGYFHVARRMLRAALRFRPGGRQASFEWDYFINGGKLDWFQYGN